MIDPETPSPAAEPRPPQADFTLRASGRTYIERTDEAARIRERIENSSSSVIGIAGVRGAGKSSLSKRVLEECAEAKYFTLLIPSPTGYEPREFLIAIFQRIGEQCIESIGSILEGPESLLSMGLTKAKELRRRYWVLIGALVVGLTVVMALGFYEYMIEVISRDVASTRSRIDDLTAQISEIQASLPRATPTPSARAAAAGGAPPDFASPGQSGAKVLPDRLRWRHLLRDTTIRI